MANNRPKAVWLLCAGYDFDLLLISGHDVLTSCVSVPFVQVLLGRKMEDWLRFSVCYWHSFCGTGNDGPHSHTHNVSYTLTHGICLHNTHVVPSTCKVLTRLGSPPSRDPGTREPPWRQPGRGSMLLLSSSPNWVWVQLHRASQRLFRLGLSSCHWSWISASFRMGSHALISLCFFIVNIELCVFLSFLQVKYYTFHDRYCNIYCNYYAYSNSLFSHVVCCELMLGLSHCFAMMVNVNDITENERQNKYHQIPGTVVWGTCAPNKTGLASWGLAHENSTVLCSTVQECMNVRWGYVNDVTESKGSQISNAPVFRDMAPEGSSLEESNRNLDEMTDLALQLQNRTGVKVLWVTCNLFAHSRSGSLS